MYPLTLLNVSIAAMRSALVSLKRGETPASIMNFEELKQAVGFPSTTLKRRGTGPSESRLLTDQIYF